MSANVAWNIAHFRAPLVRALIADGHEVTVAAVDDGTLPKLRAMGARTIALPMESRSLSVVHDLALFVRFVRLMRRERPDVFLGWTIKPNIYGSLAAALTGVPAIANISGLGTAFIRPGWLNWIARRLYQLGLARASTIFFQNGEDRALFLRKGMARPAQAVLLPGSGIDPAAFDPAAYPREEDGLFRFLLIARLIGDKGVAEYVAAAELVRRRHPRVRFQILGALDAPNRTAIPRARLEAWVADGVVDYLGVADDVRPHIARADCIVLPSYREGLPRVLLEAAAMARPAIATDVPGCRDVVADGRTGLLCRPRDAADLAAKMEAMLAMPDADRKALGREARAVVTDRFSEESVIGLYRQAISRTRGSINPKSH
jgi:glycosyltransferase involved in cell wall biosynthesis